MFDHATEKTVYFVRHGQSEDNTAAVFQSDHSPLSEKGREQAHLIAKRAANISFDALISSPLPRTKDTAVVISAATGKIPEYSGLFIEMQKPTALKGTRYDDGEASALWEKWYESEFDGTLRVQDGENFTDLTARVDAALEFLLARSEQSLLVVTHGFFLRTLLLRVMLGSTLSGTNLRHFQEHANTENTGISVIRHNTNYHGTGWRLWIYNDHSHLG